MTTDRDNESYQLGDHQRRPTGGAQPINADSARPGPPQAAVGSDAPLHQPTTDTPRNVSQHAPQNSAPRAASRAPLTAPSRPPASAGPSTPAPKRGGGGEGGGGVPPAATFLMNTVSLLFAAGMLLAIGAGLFAALYLNHLSEDLPDYQALADYKPPVTTRVYAGDGSLVAEFARERRIFVPAEAMPPLIKEAFISAEDKKFYDHGGVDFKGVIRAQISNVSNIARGRRLEGGSTITQQVAKNFLLSSEQKIERKLREWMVSRRIEKAYAKDQILELYLNEIYLGNRSYGVAAAALNYFDKSLDELNIEEAAYLAAIPKGPSNYHPVLNYDRALERRNWVIGRMAADGKISRADADAAQASTLDAVIAPPLGARDWASEYFAEEVRKEIASRYGVEALYDGGLAVRTTLDPRLQQVAGNALRKWLSDYDRRHGWRGPIGTLPVEGEWKESFNALLKQYSDNRKIAADLEPWAPAIVTAVGKAQAEITLADEKEGVIPLERLSWARELRGVDDLGPEVESAADVLNVGDVILVEPARVPPVEPDDRDVANVRPTTDDQSSPVAGTSAVEIPAVEIIDGEYELRQVPAINGGLVAMDPHTGRVLAMVGGFSFQLSEFNRSVQALRQPGSTFKPFVYAAALDNGYTPSSIVLDAPFVAPGVDSWWKPGNYVAGRFYGESTLRLGIEQSRNTMTARLAQELGIGRIIEYAKRFRLADRLPRELAISLGSGETTLMRMTSAYSTFVNGGKAITPFVIDRVQDRDGLTVFRQDDRECRLCDDDMWTEQFEPVLSDTREQVIDPRTAYQMVSMLEGVVRRGTGSVVRKRINSKPLAGKTGTTNEYKDAWFVGFAPDLAAGVYIGFDLPQTLGQGEAGGKVAAPIFAEFMDEALKETAGIPFRVPSGIRLVRVNARTGRPANARDSNVILEAFKAEDDLSSVGVGDDDNLALDPLSAPPLDDASLDDLNGLY